MTYYRSLFIFLLYLPVLVHAQLHNTMQRERLMALGIDSIEKTEILLDSMEEPVKECMIEKIWVNNLGYLTRIETLDESGKCNSIYENDYLDTLLMESRYYIRCFDTGSVMITRYQYDKSKRLKSFSLHSRAGKMTTISHIYGVTGQLLSKKQTFHRNKLTGKKGGKEIWQYTYAPNGTLARMDVVSGSGKKAKKRFYTYQYDVQKRRIATYETEKEDIKGFLIEKRGYELNGELAFTDHCYRSAITTHSGYHQIKVPAGACTNTTYVYNTNGLINEERISVDQKMKKIIQYKYF